MTGSVQDRVELILRVGDAAVRLDGPDDLPEMRRRDCGGIRMLHHPPGHKGLRLIVFREIAHAHAPERIEDHPACFVEVVHGLFDGVAPDGNHGRCRVPQLVRRQEGVAVSEIVAHGV